jgi:hypothetical protein
MQARTGPNAKVFALVDFESKRSWEKVVSSPLSLHSQAQLGLKLKESREGVAGRARKASCYSQTENCWCWCMTGYVYGVTGEGNQHKREEVSTGTGAAGVHASWRQESGGWAGGVSSSRNEWERDGEEESTVEDTPLTCYHRESFTARMLPRNFQGQAPDLLGVQYSTWQEGGRNRVLL